MFVWDVASGSVEQIPMRGEVGSTSFLCKSYRSRTRRNSGGIGGLVLSCFLADICLSSNFSHAKLSGDLNNHFRMHVDEVGTYKTLDETELRSVPP